MLPVVVRVGVAAVVAIAVAQVLAGEAVAVKVEAPPGAVPYPAGLSRSLGTALIEKGGDYVPRTRHVKEDGSPKFTNRLILESSPYLQQHAHNPVDWSPWGDEAFERARRENKPVLLSVGYATCHWCHVMEEESFEDPEIAAYMNEHYIPVKVDRERRPDVDGVYMTAVRLMTRRGGWPMTVWLTPDREPFYGGTYFPPRDGVRGSRMGFLSLLERLHEEYQGNPDKVAAAAADIARRVEKSMAVSGGDDLPTAQTMQQGYDGIAGSFDEVHGGFGRAPKFPRSVQLEHLMRYHRRTGQPEALRMVERTLTAMAAGGMYDQIGGGFHRYATDARWLVPHFEKMLYDNALLVAAYLEAYQLSGEAEYARVVRETLAYVAREMTSPEGAFYSATDADSEGEEGTFFVWTPAEIDAALPPGQARLVKAYYGVSARGNFEGKNILHVSRPLAEVAGEIGLEPSSAQSELRAARSKLYDVRRRRPPPLTDRKILPAWNGLMISAFARAAQVLGEPEYARRAVRAADFLLSRMMRGGRLQRSYLAGKVGGSGYLDDYAFLTAGLLDLFEATFEARWLREAITLQKTADQHFWDDRFGGYFLTADDQEALLAREKPDYDGAEPAGNSVAILNLLRLYEFTGEDRYRERAEKSLQAFESTWKRRPAAVPRMLGAVDFWLDRPKEVVIVVPDASTSAEPFLAQLRATFLPNRIVAVVSAGGVQEEVAALVPLVREKRARGGRPTAYVCEQRVCDLPTADPQVFAQQLARTEPLSPGR